MSRSSSEHSAGPILKPGPAEVASQPILEDEVDILLGRQRRRVDQPGL